MKHLLLITVSLLSLTTWAQQRVQPIYQEYVNSADILWKKLVWRRIDIMEASNAPLRYRGTQNTTQTPFAELVLQYVKEKKIRTYASNDDDLASPINADSLKLQASKFAQDVQTYMIQEVWYFDRVKGQMIVNILAISPEVMTDGKLQALFTVDYTELRNYLALPVPCVDTTSKHTFADYFENRQFSSRITRVENIDHSSPYAEPVKAQTTEKTNKKKKHKKGDADVMTDVWIY